MKKIIASAKGTYIWTGTRLLDPKAAHAYIKIGRPKNLQIRNGTAARPRTHGMKSPKTSKGELDND